MRSESSIPSDTVNTIEAKLAKMSPYQCEENVMALGTTVEN